MSGSLISTIKASVIDPNLSGERFTTLAQEFGYDVTKNFRDSDRLDLIQNVTIKLLKLSEEYLKMNPDLNHGRILLPHEKDEISTLIKERIKQTCHLNKDSYCGYSTDPSGGHTAGSSIWPGIWSVITWPLRSQSSTKS